MAVFAWATITFIAAAAVPQHMGVNTVGFMVMPAFVFMITVLGQRRLSMATVVYTALLFAAVTVDHLMALPNASALYQDLANTVISAGLITVFAWLGHYIAQIVGRQVREAGRTALRYRNLFDRLPVAAFVVKNHIITDHNAAAALLFDGSHGSRLKDRPFMDLIPEGERAATHTRMVQARRLVSGEGLPLRDLTMRALDGRSVAVTVTSIAIDPDEETLLSLIIDRTREDDARLELRKSQELLQALFRASSHGMAVSDYKTGEYLLVNPAFAEASGRQPRDMIGRTSLELGLVTKAGRDAMLSELREQGELRNVALLRTDAQGVVREQRCTFNSTDLDGRAVLVSVGHDVTDDMRRERELRAILEATPAAIAVIRHGRVTAASAQYERLMGLSPGSAIGRSYDEDIGGADAMTRVGEHVHVRLRAGETISYEHTLFRADGSSFPGLLTGRLIKPGAPDGFGMVWVYEDLTERWQREDRLARAKADAEAASRAKTGFLAAMSHEIRTPLNGIMGLIELMQDANLPAATRHHYLDLMSESAQSLQTIVSDVIDVSRIESGRLELERQVFDIGVWLESIRAAFTPLAEAKGLSLTVNAGPANLGWVQGDAPRLRQILANYLSNALKFTLTGSITVGLQRLSPQRVRLEVRDTGIGIEADTLQRLFQPYSQLHQRLGTPWTPGPDPNLRSSGLGLSICRQLAELMGGQAGVESEHGLGSCFWVEVELPCAPAPVRGSAAATETSLEGLSLLVVDDNRINRVVARQLLERQGARVEVAEGGQQALELFEASCLRGSTPDLVLMDIQMPGMDGLQALARLRRQPGGQSVPVLAVSAAVTTDEVDLTRSAGFDGFVSKPLETSMLIKVVRSALAARESRF